MPVFVDLQHKSDDVLQISPEMLRIIINVLQVSVEMLQVGSDLQQKIRSGPPVILEEPPREDCDSFGIVVSLQVDPDLQQNKPALLQVKESGSPLQRSRSSAIRRGRSPGSRPELFVSPVGQLAVEEGEDRW